MSEQSMKCKDCVLKHIANAMSYAKEILAGHGIGGTPDHRPDYLGELTNAEHHLEHISVELLNRVMVIRTAAQMRRMIPTDSEIDQLRELWIDVEAFEVPEGAVMVAPMAQTEWVKQDGSKAEAPERKTGERVRIFDSYPDLEKMGKVGILLADEWTEGINKEKYDLFMKLLGKHMKNGEIMSFSDIEAYEGKYLWVIPFNCFIALDADMKAPLQAYVSEGRKPSFMPRLVETEKFNEARKETESTNRQWEYQQLPTGLPRT